MGKADAVLLLTAGFVVFNKANMSALRGVSFLAINVHFLRLPLNTVFQSAAATNNDEIAGGVSPLTAQ